ncbi:MAG TPA: serine/threonine-protein kinase [Planctomycetota bacterium]|nr:serine/threonine-protein kinase [Planctomycetota bacterium]
MSDDDDQDRNNFENHESRSGPTTPNSAEIQAKISLSAIDRYVPRRDVTLGGQGSCKVVFDQLSEREVIMKASNNQTPGGVERIVKEARYAAKLNHPNAIRLLDLGAYGKDQVYMTMPLIEGVSLDQIFRRIAETGIPGLTGYSVTAMAELFDKVCAGVEHAHIAGILHLDLKPENVVVGTGGEVVVVDFGEGQSLNGPEETRRFATNVDIDSAPGLTTTLTGVLEGNPDIRAVGTPAYMSPEQWNGDPGTFTERTDIYGLGGILFFLLCGHAPNQVQRPTDLEPYFRHSPVPKPSDFTHRRVPPELEALCLKCLARDQKQRFTSVFQIRHELRSWLGRSEMWELYRNMSNS